MNTQDENEQFRQKHLANYKANLQKASKKLGLPLTAKNLPVLAREVRDTQFSTDPAQPKGKSKSKK